MQDLLDRIRIAKPTVLQLSTDDTAKLSAYLKTHPNRIKLSEVQQAKRGDSVLRDKLDADRDRHAHLKLTAEYNRNRPRAGATADSSCANAGDAGSGDPRQEASMSEAEQPDRLTATRRLLERLREMLERITTETNDTHIGDIDGLVTEAAYCCHVLNLPNPPLEHYHYSRGCDEQEHGPKVNGIRLRRQRAPWAFAKVESRPEICVANGYRLYNPCASSHMSIDDILTIAFTDCDDPSRHMMSDSLEGTCKTKARARVAEVLRRWEHYVANELLPEAERAVAKPVAAVAPRVKSEPATVGADGAVDTGTTAPAKAPPRARKAHEQYRKVCRTLDNEKLPDHEAYEWLEKTNKAAEKRGIDTQENTLPQFDTWQRNLRLYRNANDSQKNSSKTGRAVAGKSITDIHGIEPQSLPVAIRPKQYD